MKINDLASKHGFAIGRIAVEEDPYRDLVNSTDGIEMLLKSVFNPHATNYEDGLLIEILKSEFEKEKIGFDVHGLFAWHEVDTAIKAFNKICSPSLKVKSFNLRSKKMLVFAQPGINIDRALKRSFLAPRIRNFIMKSSHVKPLVVALINDLKGTW
jgi:hypothetical protein